MPETVLQGDVFVNGNLRSVTSSVPANAIQNAQVAPGAAIDTAKLNHRHQVDYAQPNTTAVTETKVRFRCYGSTGSVLAFHAGSLVANIGAATVTIDLQKSTGGGAFASILSAVITLNNASAIRTGIAGTVSVPGLVAGDILQVVVVATAGGGTLATGVFAIVVVDELAA